MIEPQAHEKLNPSLSTVTDGQSSLKICLSKSIVTDSKNTQVKLGSNDQYFYLNKS